MKISGPTEMPPQTPDPQDRYTTQAGDTLSSVAGRFNIGSDVLARANNISESAELKPGIELLIPSRSSDVDARGIASIADEVVASPAEFNPFEEVAGAWADSVSWMKDGPMWTKDGATPIDVVSLPEVDIEGKE